MWVWQIADKIPGSGYIKGSSRDKSCKDGQSLQLAYFQKLY